MTRFFVNLFKFKKKLYGLTHVVGYEKLGLKIDLSFLSLGIDIDHNTYLLLQSVKFARLFSLIEHACISLIIVKCSGITIDTHNLNRNVRNLLETLNFEINSHRLILNKVVLAVRVLTLLADILLLAYNLMLNLHKTFLLQFKETNVLRKSIVLLIIRQLHDEIHLHPNVLL